MTICSQFPCGKSAAPGCNGRCERHARKTDAGERKLYGSQHKRLRLEAFARDGYACRECGWIPDFMAKHLRAMEYFGIQPMPAKLIESGLARLYGRGRWLEADHHFSAQQRPDIQDSLDNIWTLCNVCHAIKTAAEAR